MAFKSKQAGYDYANQFNREAYDRVTVMVPRGGKDEIKAAAARAGESVNTYIKTAICQRMERDRAGADPGREDPAGASLAGK